MDDPVYVEPTSIVHDDGQHRVARRARLAGRSPRDRAALRSPVAHRTAQCRVSRRSSARRRHSGGVSAYTYSHIREQVSGFSSTAGNPLDVFWATSGQGPHSVNYSLRYNFFSAVHVNWTGIVRSGNAFTPMISGDVNGDGYSNDRAFIYAPTTAPTRRYRAGMRSCWPDASSGDARLSHRGRSARSPTRNSCRGPWSSTASLNLTLDRAQVPDAAACVGVVLALQSARRGGPAVQRLGPPEGLGTERRRPISRCSMSAGSTRRRSAIIYEVNQRFGATRPQFLTLRSPVTLTASMKFDLGAAREQQSLLQQLNSGRTTAGRADERGVASGRWRPGSITNPMATILRQQDSLHSDVDAGRQHRVDESALQLSHRLAVDAGRALSRDAAGAVPRERGLRPVRPRAARADRHADRGPSDRVRDLLTRRAAAEAAGVGDQLARSALSDLDSQRHRAVRRREQLDVSIDYTR